MDVEAAFKLEEKLNVFRVPVRITNPKNNISLTKYCVFDTGFTGHFALDKNTIQLLGLKRLAFGKAKTVTGIFEFETYQAFIELIDDKDGVIYKFQNLDDQGNKPELVPIQTFNINLIGMKAIKQKSWVIPKNQNMLILLKDML
jgi:predicted aspartyl protease